MSNKKTIMLSALSILAGTAAFGEITTGWQSPLVNGNYDWADTANWANGEINGIFSSDLVGSGKTYPNITFAADTELPDGLTLAYVNDEQNFVFRGDGGDRTLSLGDDFTLAISGKLTKGYLDFGSTTANQNLNWNLCGDRVFHFESYGAKFYGTIAGGELTVTGTGDADVNLTLAGNGSIASNAVFTTRRGLSIYEKSQYVSGCRRAEDVRLESGYLVYEGTEKGSTATADSIGRLILAPGLKAGGLVRFQNYGSSSYRNAHLTIDEIVRENETMMDFHAYNNILGAKAIGEDGSVNVTVTKGVTTVGTGLPGSAQTPVVPWARGSATTNGQGTDQYFTHLVTYDADRGFRLLDPDTEYDTYSENYTGAVRETNGNVRVTGGNVVFTGSTTVNSFSTLASPALTVTVTDGVMTILSGVLDLSVWNNVTVNGNFDFGEQTAYITQCGNKSATLQGTIKGRNIVFGDNLIRPVYSTAPLALQSSADISGDVYVNGSVSIANDSFFPHGDKMGRTIINGMLRIFTVQVTLNGLSGRGRIIYGQSYATNLTIGDNDADGDFEGSIERTGGTMSLTKVGAGTQRFGDTVTVNSTLKINGGTAIFDGGVAASSVTVAAGAAIGGKGVINTSLAFTGNATLAASKGEGKALAPLTVNGPVTAGGTVTVSAASEDWRGESCVLASTEPLTGITFAKGANIKGLELRNDGKELWARNISGLIVIIK